MLLNGATDSPMTCYQLKARKRGPMEEVRSPNGRETNFYAWVTANLGRGERGAVGPPTTEYMREIKDWREMLPTHVPRACGLCKTL